VGAKIPSHSRGLHHAPQRDWRCLFDKPMQPSIEAHDSRIDIRAGLIIIFSPMLKPSERSAAETC
jgi:hypothetical protein